MVNSFYTTASHKHGDEDCFYHLWIVKGQGCLHECLNLKFVCCWFIYRWIEFYKWYILILIYYDFFSKLMMIMIIIIIVVITVQSIASYRQSVIWHVPLTDILIFLSPHVRLSNIFINDALASANWKWIVKMIILIMIIMIMMIIIQFICIIKQLQVLKVIDYN